MDYVEDVVDSADPHFSAGSRRGLCDNQCSLPQESSWSAEGLVIKLAAEIKPSAVHFLF